LLKEKSIASSVIGELPNPQPSFPSEVTPMLKYLEWSKDDIKENWKRLKEDAIEQGLINFHANLAEEQGDPKPLHKDDEEDW
jgi:hypothetical protein